MWYIGMVFQNVDVASESSFSSRKSLSQVFAVEADDSAEAIERISDAWDNGRIELDNPELCDTDFSLLGRVE